jgi:hypothetical protein
MFVGLLITYGPSMGCPALSVLEFMIPLLIAMVEAKAQKSPLDTWIKIFQNMFIILVWFSLFFLGLGFSVSLFET